MNKSDFKTEFFNAVLQVAKMEGFSILRWTRSSSHMYLKKEMQDGLLKVTIYLDNKYLPRTEGWFTVYYPITNNLLFEQIGIELPRSLEDKEGWRCATNSFGKQLSILGMLDEKHSTGTSFDLSEKGLREAVDFVRSYYFETGARLVQSNSNSIEDMDTLINGHTSSLGYPEEYVRLPYFMYTPFQAITGTALACILKRDDRQRLVECHVKNIDDWTEEDQYILAKIVNHYIGEGILKPSTQLDAALKYLK
jgi:hypothetical protein